MSVTGIDLLCLPTDILGLLSTYIDTKEWARGPSLTCHMLNSLTLPSMDIFAQITTKEVSILDILLRIHTGADVRGMGLSQNLIADVCVSRCQSHVSNFGSCIQTTKLGQLDINGH